MKKLLWSLVLLLFSGLFVLFLFIRSNAPDYNFQLHSAEISAPVEVMFDDMAVPHIYADTEVDGMYALGYVHASERLWQMDLLRRAGAGELAELLGSDMVENDQHLRTLGMREVAVRTAAEFEAEAPKQIRSAMHAYLLGINSYIETGQRPIEYQVLGESPRPFTVRDVYASTGFMAYSFAIQLKTEPILDWMKNNLDSVYWDDLAVGQEGFTQIPSDGKETLDHRDASGLSSRVSRLDALRPVPQWLGSNAWVIGEDLTASGKVLFCNDAHMAYASPSVWYEVHLVTPDVEYYGNHLAGLPFPAIGHTHNHAWGITMFVNDDIDLYRETIDGDLYLHGGEWLPIQKSTETIVVAGGDSVEFELRKTHHGPLIEEDVAMWWTYTQYPENLLHEAFYGFSRSSDMNEFQQAASLVHAPGLNLMYGDDEGNIAWWASAKLPIRPDHVDTKTLIDGSDSMNDSRGWFAFDQNPQAVNPASGFVYSANNAPLARDGMKYPGHYYSGNTRAKGIVDALSSDKRDWKMADAQALQLDHHSLVYENNAAIMVSLAGEAGEPVEAFLQDWTGSHLGHELAPTLYYRWMYRTIEGAMADEFSESVNDGSASEKFEAFHHTLVSENTFPRLLARLDSPWWDDASTPTRESAPEIVAEALIAARLDLTEALGPDVDQWRYDRLHTVTHRHAMSDVPLLGDWLDVGPFSLPAAKDALNKYEFKLKKEVNYEVFSGPSMRIAIDFANVEAAESILPTGQSGNPFSPFYANQSSLYHAGKFRKQRMNRDDVQANQTARAIILPEQ
jgi:penicillin amidase